MNYKFKPNLFAIIIILIVGSALFNQFDNEPYTFQKIALSIVYGLVIIIAIVFMVKKNT